jgi:hypothetical protein
MTVHIEGSEIMSLKEKSKTLVQIIEENCPYVYFTRCRDCTGRCEFEGTEHFAGKWIRVEDVEQEIKKVKELGAEAASIMVEGELKDLKQKLRQFKRSLEIQLDILKSKPHHSETETQLEIMLNEFKEKFEELLKGGKE